jgi:hypothetical protein
LNPLDFLTQNILPSDCVLVFPSKKHSSYILMYSQTSNCVFVIIHKLTLLPFLKKCKTALQNTQADLIVLIPFFSRSLIWNLLKQAILKKNLKCFFYKQSYGQKIEIIDMKTFQLSQGGIYITKPAKVDLKTSSKNEYNKRIFTNEISFRLLHDEKFRHHAKEKVLSPSKSMMFLLKRETYKTIFSFLYYKLIQKLEG